MSDVICLRRRLVVSAMSLLSLLALACEGEKGLAQEEHAQEEDARVNAPGRAETQGFEQYRASLEQVEPGTYRVQGDMLISEAASRRL